MWSRAVMPTGKRGGRRNKKTPNPPRVERGRDASPPSAPRKGKLTYKDQRDYDLLPGQIEALDAAIIRDEAALHDPALYAADPAKFATLTKALDRARADKDAAEERWLALAELVEG